MAGWKLKVSAVCVCMLFLLLPCVWWRGPRGRCLSRLIWAVEKGKWKGHLCLETVTCCISTPTLLFTKHHLKRWQLMNSIPSFLCKKIIIAALRKVQRNHFLFPKQPRCYTNRVTRNAGSSVSTASFSICNDTWTGIHEDAETKRTRHRERGSNITNTAA